MNSMDFETTLLTQKCCYARKMLLMQRKANCQPFALAQKSYGRQVEENILVKYVNKKKKKMYV